MYGKKNFALFIFLASIVVGIGLALAFVRVAGLSLPATIVNFFKYSITPRLYFWKKKEVFKPTFYKLEESKKEKKYFKF